LLVELFELHNYFHATFTHEAVFAIEQQTIIKTSLNILYHFVHFKIIIMIKSLLYCPKINRFFYNLKIVRNLQSIRVYRMMENLGRIYSPEAIN
jgi:hypothetical protein